MCSVVHNIFVSLPANLYPEKATCLSIFITVSLMKKAG